MKKTKKFLYLTPLGVVTFSIPFVIFSCSSSNKDNSINHPSIMQYIIQFKNQNEFPIGDNQSLASDLDKNWFKKRIIERRNEVFDFSGSLPSNFSWDKNLLIKNTESANNNEGSIVVEVSLLNSNSNNDEINKKIKLVGFQTQGIALLPDKYYDELNKTIFKLKVANFDEQQYKLLDENNLLGYIDYPFNVIVKHTVVDFLKEVVNNRKIIIKFKIRLSDYAYDQYWTKTTSEYVIEADLIDTPTFNISIRPPKEDITYYGRYYKLEANVVGSNGNLSGITYKWNFDKSIIEIPNSDTDTMPYIEFLTWEPVVDAKIELVVSRYGTQVGKSEYIFSQDKPFYFFIFTKDLLNREDLEFNNSTLSQDLNGFDASLIKNVVLNNKESFFNDYNGNDLSNLDYDQKISIENIDKNQEYGILSFDMVFNHYIADQPNESHRQRQYIRGFNHSKTNKEVFDAIETKIDDLMVLKLTDDQKADTNIQDVMDNPENYYEKYFEYNYETIWVYGGYLDNVKINITNQTSLDITLTISLDKNRNISKSFKKIITGFRVENGLLDRQPLKILSTPSNATSLSNQVTILTNELITQNAYQGLATKYRFSDIPREFAYHGRFILWQSFGDDKFSEVNYYWSQNNDGSVKVVVEAVVKQDVNNHSYMIQMTNDRTKYNVNLKSNEIIRITFNISNKKYDGSIWNDTTMLTNMPWSFIQYEVDKTSDQFGINLPDYEIKIEQNNKQIYYHPKGQGRLFSFVIGRLKE